MLKTTVTLKSQNAEECPQLFPFDVTDPVLPFAHFADDGIADVDQDDHGAVTERPVQMSRSHRQHQFAAFLMNRIVRKWLWLG